MEDKAQNAIIINVDFNLTLNLSWPLLMNTIAPTKIQKVTDIFNHNFIRLFLTLLICVLLKLPFEIQFVLVFSLNLPHVFISSYLKSSQYPNEKQYLLGEVLLFILMVILSVITPKLVMYAASARFILHFFEDKFFNLKTYSLGLSLCVLAFVIMDDYPQLTFLSPVKLIALSLYLIIAAYFLKVHKDIKQLSNFYIVLPLISLLFIIFKVNLNRASWGLVIGIVHALIWLSWQGIDKNGMKTTKFLRSSSMIWTVVSLLAFGLFINTNGLSLMDFLRHYQLPFYGLLFFHVFSKDIQALSFSLKKS